MCDHCGCNQPETGHDPLESAPTTVRIEQDLLAHDRAHAAELRERLDHLDTRLINIIGSPGCGKTALVCALIARLVEAKIPCAVVEGDLATDNDARKIRRAGAKAHQIITGTACHLTAHHVAHAIDHLDPTPNTAVLVENVGNLVCPTLFDLGESLRLVCLSVTEGTDKPQKYPVTFAKADAVIITKQDLLCHVDFDLAASTRMIRHIKPGAPCLVTSAVTGAGLDAVVGLIRDLWEP